MSYLIAVALGLVLGAIVRVCGLPTASPPTTQGVLVVVALTVGWRIAAFVLARWHP